MNCSNCGVELENTAEAATAEFIANFGRKPEPEEIASVCGDCYDKIMTAMHPRPFKRLY